MADDGGQGVVARVIDELRERIDVVYIASNGSIAPQNINRTNVAEAKDAALLSASRVEEHQMSDKTSMGAF